jgi:hypothetical protein
LTDVYQLRFGQGPLEWLDPVVEYRGRRPIGNPIHGG